MVSKYQNLHDLADSWDAEAAGLLLGTDANDIDDREDISLAHYLRSCSMELRKVLSEVEKESPDPPHEEVRAAIAEGHRQKVADWYGQVLRGETGDSFGECVNNDG